MIQLAFIGNHPNVNNKHYIVDTISELSEIEELSFGYTAYCLEDKNTYIVDGTGEFVQSGSDCPPFVKGS